LNILTRFISKITRKINVFLFDKQLPLGVNKPIKHVLIINWNGKIGDAIVSSFFFREIKKNNNIVVSIVTTESLKSLYLDYYGADNVYTVSNKFICFQLWRISRRIKDVDTVIPLMGYLNFKDLFFISKLSPKNLFSLDDELGLCNIKMRGKTDGLLIHEIFAFILNQIGVQNINDGYIIPVINKNSLQSCDIVFNPFASRIDKSLSISKSTEVLRLLINNYPEKIIGIISSPETSSVAHQISNRVNNKAVSVIININSFYDAIDIINKANVVISADTSLVHIASGLNKKLVAIYYKPGEQFNRWLTKKSINTEIIYSQGTEEYEQKNMDNFNGEDVIEAVNRLYNAEKLKTSKNVFLYWDTGEENIPLIHKMNIDNIKKRLDKTKWNVIVTSLVKGTDCYIENFIELPDYFFDIKDKILDSNSINGNQSDIIRLRLLEKYGGVYFDTSTILLKNTIEEIQLYNALMVSEKSTLAAYSNYTFTRKNPDGSDYFRDAKDGIELGILYSKKNSKLLSIFNQEIDKYWLWKSKDNNYKDYPCFKEYNLTAISFLNEYHIHYSIFHMIITRDNSLLSHLTVQSIHMCGKENSLTDGPYSISDRFCRGESCYSAANPKLLLSAFLDGDLKMYNGVKTTLDSRVDMYLQGDLFSVPGYMRKEIENHFKSINDYKQIKSAYKHFYTFDC